MISDVKQQLEGSRVQLALFILAVTAIIALKASAAVALFVGVALALTVGNPIHKRTSMWAKYLLQISIVGLGAGMDLLVVGRVGLRGIGYTAVTIVATLAVGTLIGRALKCTKDTSSLISVGTAICGGSAIAAVSAAIKAKSEDISVSLAVVFILNAIALFIFPPIGHALNLTQEQFGLWSALAVHDTSSVVGTALQFGTVALKIGTTVKLARALWIIPLTIFFSSLNQRGSAAKSKINVPWFILGFIVTAAVVTFVPFLQDAGQIVAEISRRLLVVTLFLIGYNLTRDTIKKVGLRPFLQGFALWVVVGVTTVLAIKGDWLSL